MKGFIIAKPKKSADDISVADTYVDTQAPILKVAARGSGDISFAAAETSTTKEVDIPYDLGYKPLIQAFAERRPGANMCLVQSTTQTASTDIIAVVSFVDDKSITLLFESLTDDPSGVYHYVYYIFYDPSEE